MLTLDGCISVLMMDDLKDGGTCATYYPAHNDSLYLKGNIQSQVGGGGDDEEDEDEETPPLERVVGR